MAITGTASANTGHRRSIIKPKQAARASSDVRDSDSNTTYRRREVEATIIQRRCLNPRTTPKAALRAAVMAVRFGLLKNPM